MIRQAKFGDIPEIARLMQAMYLRSKYVGRDEIDIKEAKALAVQSVQRHGLKTPGGTCVFVAQDREPLTGFIIGVLDRVYHIGRKLMATDIFWYADDGSPRDAIMLFDAYLKWAGSVPGVIELKNGATDAIGGDYSRVAKLYERRGFKQTGVIYEKAVQS